jgi:SAM-dependent methyltransferase
MSDEKKRKAFFEKNAILIQSYQRKNRYYHSLIRNQVKQYIPPNRTVLEIGCGAGDLLAALKPSRGMGVDISPTMIDTARRKHPGLEFAVMDAEALEVDGTFDYIVLSDLVGLLWDVQKAIRGLRKNCSPLTRVIISYQNYLWEPVLSLAESLDLKMPYPKQNWLSDTDLESILSFEDFQVIKTDRRIFLPVELPVIGEIINRYCSGLPLLQHLSLGMFTIARPAPGRLEQKSVSIVIPARNERGNIENAVKRIPPFGAGQEIIFIEGNSVDGTYEEMERVKAAYPDKKIVLMRQTGKGKGNAVREAFDQASGDVLMILDADLTVPPETLPLFYDLIIQNRCEFVNGSRLVYPMQNEAMRFLNLLGNKFFGWLFSWLLGQRLKDTLCGTKVLLKSEYLAIANNRAYFGNFDPFGDFDLLFGASRLNMKITDLPIRYHSREYGETQISRFKHGILLLKMSWIAMRKLKFQ